MSVRFNRVLVLGLICITTQQLSALDLKYHKYDALTHILKNLTSHYPKLQPQMYSIGKSVRGRELWVVQLTAANESEINVPNVKLIGNIHGNEAVGREMLLHFIEYLGENYEKNEVVAWLMKRTRLHLLPSMNPDGFEISSEGICFGEHGRTNARNMDLNRNFPDFYSKNPFPTQPEAKAIQQWMKNIPFILSASLHGGALVANYPFDTVKEMTSLPVNPPSISPDDDVFKHLAKVYATKHPTMHLGKPCEGSNKVFKGGITNGAAWYPFRGGMQDFNYVSHGCMELTLEISCCKYPSSKDLPGLLEDNKFALLELIKQAHIGVRGVIFDNVSGRHISNATLKIIGREMNFTTSFNGEFWRILLPGKYNLSVNAKGYYEQIIPFEVLDYKNLEPTVLQIGLTNASISTTTSSTTVRTASVVTLTKTSTNLSVLAHKSHIENDSHVVDEPIVMKSTGLSHFSNSAISSNNNHCRYIIVLYLVSVLLLFRY